MSFKAANEILRQFPMCGPPRSSGSGWSKWSTVQQCPHKYWLRYVCKLDTDRQSAALETGQYVHGFLAAYYETRREGANHQDACIYVEKLIDACRHAGGDPELLVETERLVAGYLANYEDDYLIPLATEYTAIDTIARYTCRYDLIARIDNQMVRPGTYIVEHKTAVRFDATTLEGWDLDGEVLGQISVWRAAKLDSVFGELQGVCLNVIGKQSQQRFHRTFVARDAIPYGAHRKEISWCQDLVARCTRVRRWPRYFASCISRWGFCDYYNRCQAELATER